MPFPEWRAGQRVTAALLNSGKMEFVTNSAGSQANATTTLTNATDLLFAVTANSRWFVLAEISYDATATDAKFAWTAPAGATMGRNIIGQGSGTATNVAAADSVYIRRGTGTAQVIGGPAGVASAFSVYQEAIDLQVGSTAGTIQFQFASQGAGTCTLQGDSLIWYQQVA
jgi:hypothetical protein